MNEKEHKNKLKRKLKREAHKKHPLWRRIRTVLYQKPKTFLGTTIFAAFLGGFATNVGEGVAAKLHHSYRERNVPRDTVRAGEMLNYFNIFASLYHHTEGNQALQMMNCPTCSNTVTMATMAPTADIRLICNKCQTDYRQTQKQMSLMIPTKERE